VISGDLKLGRLLKVRGISVSIIRIDLSLVLDSGLSEINMLSFLRNFINLFISGSASSILSSLMMCYFGT